MRLCFLLLLSSVAWGQQVLFICSPQLPCPGFPLGSVQAGVDQNGWRNFKLTLTQNVTLFSFIGVPPPAQAAVIVIFTQDAIGGRTVTFASNIKNSCPITATANVTTLCQFEFDGIAGVWVGILGGGLAGLPTTTIGSVLASQGVGIPPLFQIKPVIDLRDISGIDCSGSVDSSTALAALFLQQKEYTFPAGNSSCNFKIASTIEPPSTGAWSFHGFAGAGGFSAGTTITCTMSSSPCLWFDRQRDSDFGQLNINVGSASAGLQISQLAATSGQISTNNHWHDMFISNIGSGESGILMAPTGDTGSNNELQIFSNIGLNSAGGGGFGTGFNINNPLPNCRSLGLFDVSTIGFVTGYTLGCASMQMIGGLQESNTLDFSGNPTNHNLGGGFIAGAHSENSKQWLANFASANPFGFLFNRNEMDHPDLTKFQWDLSLVASPFISIGNFWGPNANVTKMVNLPTQQGSWISIGDVLPNTTKANLPDLSHVTNAAINIQTSNRYSSSIAVSNGANGDLGVDNGQSGLYLLANDGSDGGSNQSFYTSPGLDISAVFINSLAVKVYVPWRFVVIGQQPTGTNPTATLVFKIDNDPVTGALPATTGALSADFTGAVANGGTFKLPGGSANKAVCWKADGKSIGFCSTQPDATGACTCN